MSDEPRTAFRSLTEAPTKLLARVRERLKQEAALSEAPADGLMLDLATGDGLLSGWHDQEHVGDSRVRWTARQFGFEALVGEETHVLLEALLFEESGFRELRTRIRAGDIPGAAVRLRPGWNRVFFPIPAGVSGRTHFTIDAGGSWCPAGSGTSPDERELALAVRRLELVRLPGLPRAPLDSFVLSDFSETPVRKGALFTLLRKVRRFLLGWEVPLRLMEHEKAVTRLERRLLEAESRFNHAADLLEESLKSLIREDAEARRDSADSETEWRADLARKLRERELR